jgi:hypothetical protein
LNLKEIRKAAQVAGDGRFDLRETLNYLKVEMIGYTRATRVLQPGKIAS